VTCSTIAGRGVPAIGGLEEALGYDDDIRRNALRLLPYGAAIVPLRLKSKYKFIGG
jgi:hypothetical protein